MQDIIHPVKEQPICRKIKGIPVLIQGVDIKIERQSEL